MVAFIERIREEGGKPVGVKLVLGDATSMDELCAYMARTGKGPDFIMGSCPYGSKLKTRPRRDLGETVASSMKIS